MFERLAELYALHKIEIWICVTVVSVLGLIVWSYLVQTSENSHRHHDHR